MTILLSTLDILKNSLTFFLNDAKWYFIENYRFKNPLTPEDDLELSSEDEAVASDLDMHALILGGLHQDTEPLKTAEEVIQEIDDMMQEESSSMERSPGSGDSLADTNETLEKAKEVLSSPLYEDSKLYFFLGNSEEF